MKDDLGFEEALEQMEDIVSKLEQGEQSLDDSLKMFEEGIKLYRYCLLKLEEVEGKVTVIMRNNGDEAQRIDLGTEGS